MKHLLYIPLVAILLAGCTVGPNYRAPDESPPKGWSNSQISLYKTGPIQPDWWRSFNDPILTKVVESAARSNKDLEQAAAHVREARALLSGHLCRDLLRCPRARSSGAPPGRGIVIFS